MTTTRTSAFRTANALAALVPQPIRRLLSWRVTLQSVLQDEGIDALTVQVGQSSPFRLLVVHGTDGGDITIELWKVTKKREVEYRASVPSDRVSQTLQKVAADFKLGG